MSRKILAIDPGTTESGWVQLKGGVVVASGIWPNGELRDRLRGSGQGCVDAAEVCAIEMVASYGMAVGKEVFETVLWIGRFCEAWEQSRGAPPLLVYRKDVKMHLCGSPRAKDPNIRQALLDKLGPQGTKKAPGPTYGIRSHAWAALAVGITASETMLTEQVARAA